MALEDKIDSFIASSDDESVKRETVGTKEAEHEPEYRMIADQRIPVSKKHGTIWKSRKSAAFKKLENNGDLDRWETAIDYYQADHISIRQGKSDLADKESSGVRPTTVGRETENIVFANATALVPAVYAKNPKVEVNFRRNDLKVHATVIERLLNALLAKKSAPGINLKPKARKSVLLCVLTNYAYIEVGYTQKKDASETSLVELQRLGKELAKAKDKKKIAALEGQLLALEDKVDLLRPSGPWAKGRRADEVLFDADADTPDEARFCFIADYLDTEFLKAVYGTANEDGKYNSLYEPTHVLKVTGDEASASDEIANFTLFDTSGGKTHKDYGFGDEDSFRKAQRTKVWYVWDKATRRVYLYSDADWKWPLWVWDDPYGFDDFFPVVQLEFYMNPIGFHAASEVTYYLDQQDAINAINNEIAKIREYIVGKFIYNKSILGEDGERLVEAFLEGTGANAKRALGVSLPRDVDLSKAFVPFMPQSAQALNTTLFDKEKAIGAIDRVSSVTNVMRGVEFKTNTTNKAIDNYESNTQTRLDEKIDQVEEFIGDIAWKVLQVCLKFMTGEEVGAIIGDEFAAQWDQARQQMATLLPYCDVSVVGGSTLKSNSNQKKQQAAQLGQVLGQFASASPAAIIVALKVFQEAYDEVVITAEDWQMILDSIAAQMQKGNTSPEGQAAPQGEGASPEQAAAQEQQGMDALAQVEHIVDTFPPEAKAELAKLIEASVPIREAISAVVQLVQQAQQPS